MAEEALRHFRVSLSQGRPWFRALLEAMALWAQPEEEVDGQRYCYLIGGEAFDWLLLAQRLCQEADGQLPPQEVERLLFQGEPPEETSPEEMARLMGRAKYRAYLNYFYGVVVEEALQGAVEEEIWKEKRCFGLSPEGQEEGFTRLYGAPQAVLLERFRWEKGYPQGPAIGLGELKEFTYWLFKHRLAHSEPARVASDTKKALTYLHRLKQGRRVC